MPKIKSSLASHLKQIVVDFGENIFSTDGKILFCKACEVKVAAEKKFTVQQHIGRDKHKRAIELLQNKQNKQLLLLESASKANTKFSEFSLELCDALVSSNIPLNVLNNKKLKQFMEKHMGRNIPDSSTLRKTAVIQCYENVLTKIRKSVNGKKIFVSLDEASDAENRSVVNVIIGTMESEDERNVFLLHSEVIQRVDHSNICQVFDKSMHLLWPEGVRHNDVLLFVSDGASYMVKAGKSIKDFHPNMVHVTCLAHALHRVAEKIRESFPEIDELISNTKKIFVKAPLRKQRFKDCLPDVPLPPEPILTRWGTWLSACLYYCQYFEQVKGVIDSLDSDDSRAIALSKKHFQNECLKGQLAYIKTNFKCIISAIEELQTKSLPLEKGILLIKSIKQKLSSVEGNPGSEIFEKLNDLLVKNKGFKTLCDILEVISGNNFSNEILRQNFTANDLTCFKNAPIVSVDVERSFSMLKNILADNRRSFCFENLKMHLIIYCNNQLIE